MGAIAASDKKKYQYVDYGNDDGAVLGQAAANKIGFYGYTPVSQAASIAAAVSADTASTDGLPVTSGDAIAIKLNTLISDLSDLGIIASS